MPDPSTQIDRHIAVLEDFEQKYGEYLTERHNQTVTGERRWSGREWADRERELRRLAPRAEAAMEASGLGSYELHWPMGVGGGVISDDLSTLIFEFKDFAGFSVDARDDDLQMDILARIPSQIEGLRMRGEEADQPKAKRTRHGITGRVRWIPPVIGFIVDLVAFVLIVIAALRIVGWI